MVLLQEGVAPGWIYDKASKKYSPVNTNKIEVNKSHPSFKFKILENDFLEEMIKGSNVFKTCVWTQDYRKMKGGHVFLLKGSKTVMEEGCDIVAHHEKYIVKSINFEYYADMLINFSCRIDDDVKKDFIDYLHAVVRKGNHSFIPLVINSAFLNAFMYVRGEESKEITSIKHGLHEFCRLLIESKVCCYPVTATVLKPVPNKPSGFTYAAAVKNSISETMNTSTDVAKIGQKEKNGDTHWTSNTSAKTPSMRKTIKSRNNETNPEVVIVEKSSKSEVFHLPPEKGRVQASSNTSSGNKLDDAIEKTLQSITQNMNELKKGMQHSSTVGLQMLHEGNTEKCKVFPAGVHKSQSLSNHAVNMVCRSQIITEENKSYTPKERKYTNSLIKDKIEGADRSEPLNGTRGNPYALRSKSTNSVTTSGAKMHPKNIPNCLSSECNSLDPTTDYGPVDHEKEIGSSSCKTPHKCESFSKNISKCRTVGNVSSQLKDQIQRCEKLPAVCNVESAVEKYGEANSRRVPIGQHMQMLERPQAHGDQRELEAEDLGKVEYFELNHPLNDSCKKKDKSHVQFIQCVGTTHENEPDLSFKGLHNLDGTKIVTTNVPAETNISETKFQEHHKQVTYECEGNLDMSSLYLKPLKEVNDKCGMIRKYFGVCSNMKEKTIILLGASGSGKTTLINFVANYFKGVKTADGQLVHVAVNTNDVRSHTTSITAYTFCSSLDDTPITVVDTPGLNDTSGAEVRDHVLSLKTFLANALSQNFQIHAIGFVAQAHLVRLTSSERLVMDYVSTLFGQDIAEHFITFVTFADNQETPPVVEAIKNYGVSCKIFLKFNNSALSNSKTDEIDDLDRVYWRIGSKSWKKCLKYLMIVPAVSVKTMQAVESEVYATTVIEYAERDLKAELKAFIDFCKQSRYNTMEANQTCEQVWALAAAVHHLAPVQLFSPMDVEMILVKFSEAVCKENGYSSLICIKLLSLSPTRNLVNAGIGLIQSIAPVYKSAKEVSMKRRRTTPKNVPKVLYCHQCNKYHELERVKPSVVKKCLSFVGQGSSLLTYKCSKCKCDGSLHGLEDDDPQESLDSFSLHPKKLLQHTRNCIITILESMSIPGYQIDEDYYLRHINDVTGCKFEMLINALLGMKYN